MMQMQARAIIQSSTASNQSKLIAVKIRALAEMLSESLKVRKDQDERAEQEYRARIKQKENNCGN